MANPLHDDTIKSTGELARNAPDLTDYEVSKVGQIVGLLTARYAKKPNTTKNLEAFRDEALYRFAQIGLVAEVDPTPTFYGRPPIIEIIAHTQDSAIYKHGFDHERKRHEVIEAKKRNEEYRGQKEKYNGDK